MVMETSVAKNLKIIRERIASTAEKCGRKSDDITLVAVSKGQPVAMIEQARIAGHALFGENRVQEWLEKADQLRDTVRWHLIGHLQTNKAARVVGRVDLIQSVDSVHLIEKLAALSTVRQQTCRLLLQVNTSGETSKFGFSPGQVEEACGRVEQLEWLRVDGLMTIGPFTEETGPVVKSFAALRRLYDKLAAIRSSKIRMKILSMGMSGDFEIAIREGSNLLRIGTAIFGSRNQT